MKTKTIQASFVLKCTAGQFTVVYVEAIRTWIVYDSTRTPVGHLREERLRQFMNVTRAQQILGLVLEQFKRAAA